MPEQNNRAVTSEIEPPCENPECPPNPDCPVIPEEPDDAEDKCNDKENGDDDHGRPARPYPIRRRMRAKFLPIEIFFGEIDGQRVYYIVFPPEAY